MCTRDQLRSDIGNSLQKLSQHLRKTTEHSDDEQLVRLHMEMAERELAEAALLWRRSFCEPVVKEGEV